MQSGTGSAFPQKDPARNRPAGRRQPNGRKPLIHIKGTYINIVAKMRMLSVRKSRCEASFVTFVSTGHPGSKKRGHQPTLQLKCSVRDSIKKGEGECQEPPLPPLLRCAWDHPLLREGWEHAPVLCERAETLQRASPNNHGTLLIDVPPLGTCSSC